MQDAVVIVVHGEPQGKARPRFDPRSGRAYTPAETRSYEDAIKWAATVAMRGLRPFPGHVAVDVTAAFGIPASMSTRDRGAALLGELLPKSIDLDNIVKAALDGIQKIVMGDDRYVSDLVARKRYALEPALFIRVAAVERVVVEQSCEQGAPC